MRTTRARATDFSKRISSVPKRGAARESIWRGWLRGSLQKNDAVRAREVADLEDPQTSSSIEHQVTERLASVLDQLKSFANELSALQQAT